MKEIVQWIKRTGLFLAGIVLIIWGYEANAANKVKAKEAKKAEKEKKEKKDKPKSSIFGSVKAKNDSTKTEKKQENVSTKETVVETDKKTEESSGTE